MEIILTQQAKDLQADAPWDFTPTQGTKGSAGYDVRACIPIPVVLYPNTCIKVPLGFSTHIATDDYKQNLAALVLPRSGLGSNYGIVLGNLVGLIDSDYQNEWICTVWNRSEEEKFTITPGMRIAQVIFVPVIHPGFKKTSYFSSGSERTGGFGSTGAV